MGDCLTSKNGQIKNQNDFNNNNTDSMMVMNMDESDNNFKIQNDNEKKYVVKNQTNNSSSLKTSDKTAYTDNTNSILTKCQSDLAAEKAENKNLKDENKILNDKYKDLQKKFDSIEKEKNQLIKKINDNSSNSNNKLMSEKVEILTKVNTDLHNKLGISEDNNKNLKANLQSIQNEKNNLTILINNNQTQIQNLNNELTNEKNKNQSLTQQIAQLNSENLKIKEEISKLILDSQSKETEISNLKSQIQEQERNISLLTSQSQTKENEILALKKQVTQKTKEYDKLKNDYDKLLPITVGLDNIGATCYMNATIQSFSSIKELSFYFKEKYVPNKDKKMSQEYYTVIKNLWDIKNHGKSYAPHSFKEVLSQLNPMFAGVNANDSKDLINFLLEKFHEELNSGSNKNFDSKTITPFIQKDESKMLGIYLKDYFERYQSIISNLFYGTIQTKSQCTNCQTIKYNFQIFSFLEFPLQQVNEFCFSKGFRNNYNGTGNPDIDLYECFWYYQNIATMNGDNQIFCNDCGKNCDALYGTFLYSMPNYLIINLNRGKNAVYKCNVKFPEILKLENFVKFNAINSTFQLKAVICHIGPSSMGGHFVAYCRHYMDNNWYKYNDSFVEYCENQTEYRFGMPYILFYKALK